MISLEIPVEQIPYVRTIEGRKFKNGKWHFPDHALPTLQKYGLVAKDVDIEKPKKKEYNLSPFLRGYQKGIVNDALNAGCYGIFTETGTGKSAMALEISSYFHKTLILCPLSVIETAWIDDCHKFYPDRKIVNCWANSREGRINALNEDADIYVMNSESYKILKNEIRVAGFDCMIVDESSCMKNMGSQITSMILEMVPVIPHRFVLSGCPCPNHNSEIFPQMKFVNNEIFGNNYYGFLARYFHQDMANPHIWFQTDEDKERYNLRLGEQSVFLKKEDCVDLPDKIFQVRCFDLSAEQRKYYDQLLNDIQSHINEWSKFEFTAKLMKLREVSSGFVYSKQSDVRTFNSNKPNALKEVLDDIGDKQVIIWCQFQHEIESLAKQFGGVGLTSKTKGRDEIIKGFRDGKIKYLFTHPQLLGKGLTFVNCTYNIYYSLSFSYEEFKQSQDRIHRIGQTNKCTYIILQARNTIDEKIYDCLQRKKSAVDELYNELGLKVNSVLEAAV